MGEMLIYINNKVFRFLNKFNIIQVANQANIYIPRFCFHEKLSIAGNCRMCLVEVKGSNKPIASCALPITDGMVIYTETTMVKKAREGILEFLLLNHPLDCPICDQGGECDLQDQTLLYGNDHGRFYEYKKTFMNYDFNIFIKVLMTRCIFCTRCVRFASEVAGEKTIGLLGRGKNMKITNFVNKLFLSEFSGNVIDLCPVGALTSKIYSFKARFWELKSYNIIDLNEVIHSNIRVDLRDMHILRILPRFNSLLKDYWITDITRFSYDGFINNRLFFPFFLFENKYINTSWIKILFLLKNKIKGKRLNFILGNFIDVETTAILKYFLNIYGNYSVCTINNNKKKTSDFRLNYLANFNIDDIKFLDYIVFFSINLRLENPLLNLQLKKEKKEKFFFFGSLFNYNFSTYNFGNLNMDFFNFYKGKNILLNMLLKENNILFLINNMLKNSFNNNLIFNLINKKFNKFNKKFEYFFLHNFLTNIQASDLNLEFNINDFEDFTKKNSFNLDSKKDIFYALNTDFIFLKNISDFFKIYQGHNNSFGSINYDILLPTSNYLEKKSTYLNFCGLLQTTKYIIFPFKYVRNDFNIFSILFKFLLDFSNNFELVSFISKYNIMSMKKFISDIVFEKYIIFNNNSNFYKITNNYLKNSILKSSVHMILRSLEIRKNYVNFSFLH